MTENEIADVFTFYCKNDTECWQNKVRIVKDETIYKRNETFSHINCYWLLTDMSVSWKYYVYPLVELKF